LSGFDPKQSFSLYVDSTVYESAIGTKRKKRQYILVSRFDYKKSAVQKNINRPAIGRDAHCAGAFMFAYIIQDACSESSSK
jgi:hypothetical protein